MFSLRVSNLGCSFSWNYIFNWLNLSVLKLFFNDHIYFMIWYGSLLAVGWPHAVCCDWGAATEAEYFWRKNEATRTKARRSLSYSTSVLSIAADKYITKYSGEIERISRSLKERWFKYSFIWKQTVYDSCNKKVATYFEVLEVPTVSFTQGQKILATPLDRAGSFSCPMCDICSQDPPSLLSNGYPDLFPRV